MRRSSWRAGSRARNRCSSSTACWTVLLEYEIARRGRRIDAILLMDRAVIVLEFKVGVDSVDSASRWQVYEYALDLRDFHTRSVNIPIIPIVVPTGMTSSIASP